MKLGENSETDLWQVYKTQVAKVLGSHFHVAVKISDLEDREKSSQDDYVKDEVLVKNLEQEVR
jgi:predicted Zn-dependent protease